MAMEQFDNLERLSSEFQKGHAPNWKNQLSKELFIWLICLTAAAAGPVLLMNARFTLTFVIAPLLFIAASSILCHSLIVRVRNPVFCAACFFCPILYFYGWWFKISRSCISLNNLQHCGCRLMAWRFFQSPTFFGYAWSCGLFARDGTALYSAAMNFGLWQQLLSASLNWIYSPQKAMLLVHCFLLYVFLQQMIDAKTVVKFRNKMKHLLHG